ncbi:hypothetical protein SLEP1_g47883 [Rubroshorea leprosula]|uniref:Uncharacterized protein n=1 Tax=Rubroshorea leprosula TaxID=152421 RepID=A0AAV5LSY0_9ROSI|nr:hypothetical protein SLEP1_g47883 [Rubroshorea leprosula]
MDQNPDAITPGIDNQDRPFVLRKRNLWRQLRRNKSTTAGRCCCLL